MSTGTSSHTWLRPLVIFLLLFLGLYSVLFLYHAVHLAFATGELNYAETSWLFAAVRVRHGISPYFDYSHTPYIAVIYPPLDFWIAGAIGALTGASDASMVPLTRLVTVGSTLLVALGIFTLCRALGAGRLVSTVAGLLFLTPSQTFQLWSFVARSDMLAVALGLWAVTSVVAVPGAWGLVAGGALCGLALAAKQTAIAPIVACTVWLLFGPRRRETPFLLAGFAVTLGVVLLVMGLHDDKLLANHTLDLAGGAWFPATLYARISDLLALFGPVFPLAALGAARPATRIGSRSLVAGYWGVAAFVLILTGGKLGSAGSYCLELIAISCVLAGLGLHWLFEIHHLPREVFTGLLVLAAIPVAVQTLAALNLAQSYREQGPDDRPLVKMIANRPGPVLSENGYITLHGTDPPVLLDPFYFSNLAAKGRWDPAPLTQMVAKKQFSAVVLTRPAEWPLIVQGISWFPPGVMKAVQQNYTYLGTQGRYYIYVPR